jgi:NAD(P)-dependent dehydrogenase (short-subunit alcohol dehydrogenase family)
MSMNWLEGMHAQVADPMAGQMGSRQMGSPKAELMASPMALPVFAGHKLVVVSCSSGMGRQVAGLFVPKPFLDHDGEDYDSYLELDRAIFLITQTVARGMVAQGRGGSIVTVGSTWAHQAIGATPSSAYGLHALTGNLALELAPYQIRVNAVAPAVVATPLYELFVPKDQLEETLHSFDAFRPLGRTGTTRDLANVITFLLTGHQLGHRSHLGRRRRRHGRTQLTPQKENHETHLEGGRGRHRRGRSRRAIRAARQRCRAGLAMADAGGVRADRQPGR